MGGSLQPTCFASGQRGFRAMAAGSKVVRLLLLPGNMCSSANGWASRLTASASRLVSPRCTMYVLCMAAETAHADA